MRLSSFRSPPPWRAGRTLPVLRLAITLPAGGADGLADAVMARVAAGEGQMSTVILTLEGDPPADDTVREALDGLHHGLRESGTRLCLVAEADNMRRYLQPAGPDPLNVYPTLRSAVLASYAELSGPGLVTAAIRDTLAAPSEPLLLGNYELARRR